MFVLVAVVKLSPKQNLIYEKIKKRDPLELCVDPERHL